MSDLIYGIERDRIVILKAEAESKDVNLANCCDFLLGAPTFVGINADYAKRAVAAALEAGGDPSAKRPPDEYRAADPGAIATGTNEPGTTTGK